MVDKGNKLKDIIDLFVMASRQYNMRKPHANECLKLVCAALDKLSRNSSYGFYGDFRGRPNVTYYAYSAEGSVSRPVRPDLFIKDSSVFAKAYQNLLLGYKKIPSVWGAFEIDSANKVIYTGVMSIACCYDLWQRGSRKTPGTFFEIFMAAVLKELFSEFYFSKHIPLTEFLEDVSLAAIAEEYSESVLANDAGADSEESASSLSTDLVINNLKTGRGLVVPLKITTRERIVQPFAHQRILDSAFGVGRFISYLVCISETQQDAKNLKVNQVCVPGTVKLFQRYLAPIGGVYYCDVPQRYNSNDMRRVIPIKSVGDFFVDAYNFFEL